ncbi:flavin monoamine oxidase family protein [Comamonas sp. NLF-1-9]|uniref:flavin monoamine oxidase family protein n=1 Tax=Comamonas sp. NLF-1-9 TaxID=2853163 RepID=UPI001C48A1DE|nr:flavin monoamine oxidase family protein [Comamonas sp. NLF-1-9]QXL85640.1 FAD-dependent oxidoreductase [Comamonas sp. NLF-1-9]
MNDTTLRHAGARLPFSRRQLLATIGKVAGGAAMYQAMTTLGFAAQSDQYQYHGPIKLEGAKQGASVVILGAGLAGMVAAYELRRAGYQVQILEYQDRAGGRCYTLRGGDSVEEIDGSVQKVQFAKGNYLNPGPWRVPYHHVALLDYYKKLGVEIEPFNMFNHNAYLHADGELGGKPVRAHEVYSDVRGNVAELLAKSVRQNALDEAVSGEDAQKLLASLKDWGFLDKEYRYTKNMQASMARGYAVEPGGGLMPVAQPSQPIGLKDLVGTNLWSMLGVFNMHEFATTMFEPKGGMDMLAQAFARELKDVIRLRSQVVRIEQGADGVTISYKDRSDPDNVLKARADWCVCTIPASILSQLEEIQVSKPMLDAIQSLPYGSSVKIGLEFNRRFWEEDERIYGGISYTSLPIEQISYPSTGYLSSGPAVLLGSYTYENTNSYRFTAMPPEERVRLAVEWGSRIHPQYKKEFRNGVALAWHRMPWIHGCYGLWNDDLRAAHYNDLAAIDGRIVLAGEHVSYIPAWQEGAILSSLDAITRLHAKASA